MLRVSLNQEISNDLLNELQALMYENEQLPKPTFVKDGNHYRYRFDFKTKHIEFFLRKLTTLKLENNTLDVFSEEVRESSLNKLIYALNLKNLIFPVRVIIRYTLNNKIKNPQEFKSYLESYFPDENIPDPISIGDEYFHRYKIEFQIRDTEVFNDNFFRFKEGNKDVDVYVEFDKKTLKSYINLIAYSGAILFAVTRVWEFLVWLLPNMPKKP